MVARGAISERLTQTLVKERKKKRGGHLLVKMSSFSGCCDAGDVIDGQ